MTTFEIQLTERFNQAAKPELAKAQSAYMRDQFSFLGIKAPDRQAIWKPLMSNSNRPGQAEMPEVIRRLWARPERDYQYAAQELAAKYLRRQEISDMEHYEFMVVEKSWWDTVDFIASKLIGSYFTAFPETIPKKMELWLASENRWLQRSALIFQLRYKQHTDHDLLAALIDSLADSKEFFIRKAIGWALREYSKTNPSWVGQFVDSRELSGLSRKEALRLIR